MIFTTITRFLARTLALLCVLGFLFTAYISVWPPRRAVWYRGEYGTHIRYYVYFSRGNILLYDYQGAGLSLEWVQWIAPGTPWRWGSLTDVPSTFQAMKKGISTFARKNG